MMYYTKPQLDAMSMSRLVALAQDLGAQVCDDQNLLVYNILDAQANACLREHEEQTRRKASPKAKTKGKTKGDSEEWAKSQLERVKEETKPMGVKTRELMMGILSKLSCQWEVDESGYLEFHYQGGHFQAHFCDEVPFLYVYYPSIYSVEAYQKDKIVRVKELVNRMNCRGSVKMVYVVDPDDGEVLVHIEDFFVLVPEIPYVEDYLQFMLRRVFQLQHDFVSEMERE